MSDDRNFDRLLEEELSALPPPDEVVAAVNPWTTAVQRIAWGVALTTITLNLFGLEYILPAVGLALLFLGFRTLRRENLWFSLAWKISIYQLANQLLHLAGQASIWWSRLPQWFFIGLAAVNILLCLTQLIALWRGIIETRRAAGQPAQAPAAGALAAAYVVMVVLGLIHLEGWLFVLPLLALYVVVLSSLYKLSRLLDGVGYTLTAAPVRLSDRQVGLAWAGAVLGGILLVSLLLGSYPMDWVPRPAEEGGGLEELRADLLAQGVPETVLNDLSPEELALFEGAWGVEVMEENDHDRLPGLKRTTFSASLPGGGLRMVYHFRWEGEGHGWSGTESILLNTLASDEMSHSLEASKELSGFSGRLLAEREGITQTAPFYSLDYEGKTSYGFFGASTFEYLIAEFTRPGWGEDFRGYVAFTVETPADIFYLQCLINQTFQTHPLNYPARTALEHDLLGGYSMFDTFDTVQTGSVVNWRRPE